MSSLILKRASASRSSGQWSEDDYDVLQNGVVVGRICKEQAAPPGRSWGWASGHNGDTKRARDGYAATREEAMAAFVKSWLKEVGMMTRGEARTQSRGSL